MIRNLDPPFVIGVRDQSTIGQHATGIAPRLSLGIGDTGHFGAGLVIFGDAVQNVEVIAGHDDISLV